MAQTRLESWTDPLRILPAGRSTGLADAINPASDRPFDEHLHQAERAATSPSADDRDRTEATPRPTAEREDRDRHTDRSSRPREDESGTAAAHDPSPAQAEDTDPGRSRPGAGSNQDKDVRESDSTQGKTEPEKKHDDKQGKGQDKHAAAEAEAPGHASIGAQLAAEQAQKSSDGQGDGKPGQQSSKAVQAAKPASGQPAPQQPAAADAVPEEDASAGAKGEADKKPADGQADKPDAGASKSAPATPKPAEGAAELATAAASSQAEAETAESATTGPARGRKEKPARAAHANDRAPDRATIDAAPAPMPAVASPAAPQTPAADPGEVLADATSAKGDKDKPAAQAATGATTSGTTLQNEAGGPLRPATGPGAAKAASAQGQEAQAGSQAEQARFVQRVARAFQAVGNDGGSVRLRLHPPDLGSLRLELTVRNGTLTARLEVDNHAAKHALLDNLPALRDRLAQQHIKVERFDVDLAEDHSGGSFRQPGDNPQAGRSPAWNAPPSQNRAAAPARETAGPAPVARAGEGSQLNVIV